MSLHNPVPLRVTAVIDRVPPIGARFEFGGPPVEFVTDQGTPVFQITAATATPQRVDDFRCYGVDDGATRGLASDRFILTDELGTTTGRAMKPRLLCSPSSRLPAPIVDPGDSLLCYGLIDRPKSAPLVLDLSNQLGPVRVEANQPRLLCVPGSVDR